MRWRAFIINALLVLVSSAITIELLSYFGTMAGLLIFKDVPSIYVAADVNDFRGRTDSEPWGPWRKPNSADRHVTACFDVVYKANNYGARDRDFTLQKTDGRDRYILLGDSFAEGWTVNADDTAKAKLETSLGIDVYNFGVAGYVGPVQYYLIYKDFAEQFQHDGVIVFFLPENDFTDNDFEILGRRKPTWYRPYYRKEPDGTYGYFYSDRAKPGSGFYGLAGRPHSLSAGLTTRFLKNYTFTWNLIRTARYLIGNLGASGSASDKIKSAYFDTPLGEQQAAIYFLEKIVDEAGARRVVIAVIPDIFDLRRIATSGRTYVDQYWFKTLRALERSKPNVQVVDLAPQMLDRPERYFQTCDNHWNARGNAAAAAIIAPYIADRNRHAPP